MFERYQERPPEVMAVQITKDNVEAVAANMDLPFTTFSNGTKFIDFDNLVMASDRRRAFIGDYVVNVEKNIYEILHADEFTWKYQKVPV